MEEGSNRNQLREKRSQVRKELGVTLQKEREEGGLEKINEGVGNI